MPDSSVEVPTEPVQTKRRLSFSRIIKILGILAFAFAIVTGLTWWRERPLREAEAALAENDAKYADFVIGEFLRTHPDHSRALALKARSLVKLGEAREAGEIYARIGVATSVDLHTFAQALLMEQKWSAAIPLLEQVIRMEPRNADALHELTVVHTRLGHLDEALASAERMGRLPGNEARGNLLVATIRSDMKNYAAAAEAFKKVLEHDPDADHLQVPPDAFFLQYGQILMELGKPDEALLPLRRSVAVRETGAAFTLLGNAASQLGEPDKARSAWVKAVQVEPLNVEAREALADLALQQRDPKSALEWLKPMEADQSMSSSTSYLFQRTFVALNDPANADLWKQRTDEVRKREKRKHVLDLVLVESPDSFWARFIRAHRFASNQNWGEAEMLADQLLKENPSEPLVIELVDAIRRRSTLPSLDQVPLNQY